MNRRDFLKKTTFLPAGFVFPAVFGQMRGEKIGAADFFTLATDLLTNWGGTLFAHQIRDNDSPGLRGGILCQACSKVHGRNVDSVLTFLYMADRTKQHRFLDAAVDAVRWADVNVTSPDGAWRGGNNDVWKGITVFQTTTLAESILFFGHLLSDDVKERWRGRLKSAGEFLYNNVQLHWFNINYPVSCTYTMALLGQLFDESRFKAKGAELAHGALRFFTENGLLYGEGKRPRGSDVSVPVDLGYNIEESLPALVKYGLFTGDETILNMAKASLAAHMEFMLPDGAWDNSWGTRSFKWSYWGSRTASGCQSAYVLLADRHPSFFTAARRNLELMKANTHEGILYGGPHYVSHRVLPCIQHTLFHAKGLASMLLHSGQVAEKEPQTIPRDSAYGVRVFPEIKTWLIAKHAWRATITAYDCMYIKVRHPSGGAISMLWHKEVGPLLAGSLMEYISQEPDNMQYHNDAVAMALTPRLELRRNNRVFSNIAYLKARVTVKEDEKTVTVDVRTRLTDENQKNPSIFAAACDIRYLFADNYFAISAVLKNKMSADEVKFILPVVSENREKIVIRDEFRLQIHKPGGIVTVVANQPVRVVDCEQNRIFNHVPGFEAVPAVIDWDVKSTDRLDIRLEVT